MPKAKEQAKFPTNPLSTRTGLRRASPMEEWQFCFSPRVLAGRDPPSAQGWFFVLLGNDLEWFVRSFNLFYLSRTCSKKDRVLPDKKYPSWENVDKNLKTHKISDKITKKSCCVLTSSVATWKLLQRSWKRNDKRRHSKNCSRIGYIQCCHWWLTAVFFF